MFVMMCILQNRNGFEKSQTSLVKHQNIVQHLFQRLLTAPQSKHFSLLENMNVLNKTRPFRIDSIGKQIITMVTAFIH